MHSMTPPSPTSWVGAALAGSREPTDSLGGFSPLFHNNIRLLQDLVILPNQCAVAFPSKTLIFSCITWPKSNMTKKKNVNLAAFGAFSQQPLVYSLLWLPWHLWEPRRSRVWGLISVPLKARVSLYFWFW